MRGRCQLSWLTTGRVASAVCISASKRKLQEVLLMKCAFGYETVKLLEFSFKEEGKKKGRKKKG